MNRRAFLAGAAALTGAGALAQSSAMHDLSHLSPEQRARYDAMRAHIKAAFAYERVTVPGADAFAAWEKLRTAGRGVPVVVGDDEALERLADQFSMDDPVAMGVAIPGHPAPRAPAAILADAARLRWPDDLAQWSGARQPDELRAPLGDWPTLGPDDLPDLTVASDILTRKPFAHVHILLLPAQASWEAPAWLRWGGWNECPPPEHHVAALRSWHERYGVELVGINGDTMNLRAARRPSTRDEALTLAREQYRYCPDVIEQGVGTLSTQAACLQAGEWQFLWWD